MPKTKSFHNTTNLAGADLERAHARAAYQDDLIAAIFRANPTRRIPPSQMQRLIAKKYSRHLIITSVRRSMNTLTEKGVLTKGSDEQQVMGPNGRPENTWAYNATGDANALQSFFTDLQDGRLEERPTVGQQPPTPTKFVQQELFA